MYHLVANNGPQAGRKYELKGDTTAKSFAQAMPITWKTSAAATARF
jgi:hypothetical protein